MAPTVFCVAAVGWTKREARDGMDWRPDITAPQRFWKTFGARFVIINLGAGHGFCAFSGAPVYSSRLYSAISRSPERAKP